MRHSGWRIGVVVVGMLGSAARGETGVTTTAPSEGVVRMTFTDTNPLSDLKEWVHREGGTVEMLRKAGAVYDISEESFEAYVPKEVGGEGKPWGLLVWISAGKAGWPEEWFGVLGKHHLIWVCPENAGNQRNALVRVALAMDAVYNLKAKYAVDEGRVYVAGFSGGGRAASIAAVGFPDVFTGGIFMMGTNFYRQVSAGPGKAYPVGSFRPPGKLFEEVKGHPLVLMTSEGDMNRDQTKANLAAFKRDGFKQVTLIEVPGIGHTMPGVEWLEKGIEALEGVGVKMPATWPAGQLVVGERGAATRIATADTRTEAEQWLGKGKMYLQNGMNDRAREYLQRVVDRHPGTAEAGEAKELLGQIDGGGEKKQ